MTRLLALLLAAIALLGAILLSPSCQPGDKGVAIGGVLMWGCRP